jgi:hypothetical protein
MRITIHANSCTVLRAAKQKGATVYHYTEVRFDGPRPSQSNSPATELDNEGYGEFGELEKM